MVLSMVLKVITQILVAVKEVVHMYGIMHMLSISLPKLERSMRDMDFRHNMSSDGGMQFRLQLPIGSDKMISDHVLMGNLVA